MTNFGLIWKTNDQHGEDCYLSEMRVAAVLSKENTFSCWNIIEGVVTNNLSTLEEAKEYFEEDFAQAIEDALNLIQNTYPEFLNEDVMIEKGFVFDEQDFTGIEDLMDIGDLNELHEDE
jgi:hypothetical protein